MKKHNYKGLLAVLIILLLVIIDQVIKVEVKTTMYLGESNRVTDWFFITFIENNGMAYGMSFIYKPLLTLFRIVACSAIGYYIYKVVKRDTRIGYVVCLSMILAGAAGNIFDCLFYGQVFTVSTPYNIAEFVSFGDGYAPLLQGRVVDMFYFPLWEWPDWMPLIGGQVFFSPVFNFADSCISVGVVLLLLFFRKEMETISQVLELKSEEGVEKSEENKE
ncbi:MAG: lipoprotein signal peptidase [Prevotellaceae bacterium]|nr:lipoprotein signal peptidase [Prevotellaceae bacterium]